MELKGVEKEWVHTCPYHGRSTSHTIQNYQDFLVLVQVMVDAGEIKKNK